MDGIAGPYILHTIVVQVAKPLILKHNFGKEIPGNRITQDNKTIRITLARFLQRLWSGYETVIEMVQNRVQWQALALAVPERLLIIKMDHLKTGCELDVTV